MSRHDQASDTGIDEPIAPLAYTPPAARRGHRTGPRGHWFALGAVLVALATVTWFVLGARVLVLQLDPSNTQVTVSGGPTVPFGRRVLLHPGDYTVHATAPGYAATQREVRIDASRDQQLAIQLMPLPGRIAVHTTPVIAHIVIDDNPVGDSNGAPIGLAAGDHRLRIEADRFLTHEQTISIIGRGELQTLDVTLAPGWGSYDIDSQPPGAAILVDDAAVASTPARIELLAGTHHLRLRLDGHRDGVLMIDANAGEERTLEPLTLERADAVLRITTHPEGASITLDGVFQGRAPLELAIDSSQVHELIAFKAGHERVVRSLPANSGTQTLTLKLAPQNGEVQLAIEPADADVLLDARPVSRGTRSLTLPGVEHTLRVQRSGYQTHELRFTPRPGFAQRIEVKLRPLTTPKAAAAPREERITSSEGQELVLLRPGTFTMGSSRRELGRRANETLHEVRMRRPFFIGVAEVGNGEFRRFRPAHASGEFKGKALDADTLPAVNLGWEDAALYCNWLSARDKLEPFYRVQGGHVVGFDPNSRGYRLPSEAEWAWAAGVMADGSTLRFAWGQDLPPPRGAGNFADRSGATLLGEILANYDDGFPVAAPRRSFKANRHGIFDLDGNVAEWMHDAYEPLPGASSSDPLGPQSGELHTIRGASWRNGDVTTLRLAFRDYGKGPRPDLGFRIARYAE